MKKLNIVLIAFFTGVAMAMTACGNDLKAKKRKDSPTNTSAAPAEDTTKTADGGTDTNQDLEIPSSSFEMAEEVGGEIHISIVRQGEKDGEFVERKYSGDIGLLTLSSAPYAPIEESSVTLQESSNDPGRPILINYHHLENSNEQLILATYLNDDADSGGDIYIFGRKLGSDEPFRLVSDHVLTQEFREASGMSQSDLRTRLAEFLGRTGLSHLGNFSSTFSAQDLPADF